MRPRGEREKAYVVWQWVGWPFWYCTWLQWVLVGVSCIFWKPQVAKSLLFSVTDFWSVSWNAMHVIINPYIPHLTCSLCLLMRGSDCVYIEPWRGFKFSVRGLQNWVLNQKEQFDPKGCVCFEVAHLAILMVWRLPYRRFLTLIAQIQSCKRHFKATTCNGEQKQFWPKVY